VGARLPLKRECGPCSLCCKVLAVGAIPKGRGVWCKHASRTGGGCKIYEDRPGVCQRWSCAWLAGHTGFSETDRPDRIGVVGSVEARNSVHLIEDEPGALLSDACVELRSRLVSVGVNIVCSRRRQG
jgi:hypothetical protein